MNNEIISKYKENLEENLKNLKEERQEIIEKVNCGKALSIKDNIKNKKIASQIKEIEDKLETFNNLTLLEEMTKKLKSINSERTSIKTKNQRIKELISQFAILNKNTEKELIDIIGLEETDIKDLKKLKNKVEKQLKELKTELSFAKKRNFETSDIEKDIEENKIIIEKLNKYETKILDLDKIETDLKHLANSETNKIEKATIMVTYTNIINDKKENCLNEINETIENENNKNYYPEKNIEEEILDAENIEYLDTFPKSLKEKTKEKLTSINNFFSRNRNKIIAIGSTAVLCVTIIITAKSCSKTIKENKNDDNLDNQFTIEETYENTNKEVIEALVNKGYSEYAAMLMAKNFNDATINALKNMPYIETVENYKEENEFNLDYLNDYENARTVYNLTSDKAVDYVNRSYKIFETGFYDEATINEIVEVIMAIDNKNLFMQENANLAQSFNTSFNRIVDNYLFGTTTEEDLTKLDALQYFAKEDSDLDLFLTEFGDLAKENIENPNDLDAKNKMYTYMAEFALSLNGFTNTDEDIDISEPYNTNAQVNDYFDWYMAYNSFIAPLYPTLVDENEFEKYEELQYIMLTALEDPQFDIVCDKGQSLTLGGE